MQNFFTWLGMWIAVWSLVYIRQELTGIRKALERKNA